MCALFSTSSGEGQATHLGKFTYSSTHTLDVTTYPSPVLNGELTLTAANGDQLFGTYAGASVFTDASQTVLSAVLDVTITGGTRRFASAAGTFRVTSLTDTSTHDNATTAIFAGSISSAGSNKK